MDINSMVGTGAIVAGAGTIVYSLFSQVKGIPNMIYRKIRQRFVYTVRVYQYDDLFDNLEGWLLVHHKKLYRDVEAVTGASMAVTPNTLGLTITLNQTEELSYKQESNTFIIKYQGKRLFIVKGKEKMDKAQNLKDIWFRSYVITGWRAEKQIDSLLKEAIELFKVDEESNLVKICTNTPYGEWNNLGKKKVKPLISTILEENSKKSIIDDINKFTSSEDWYTNVGIPYKRGYCFYGPPGTGKTTLAMAIANHTKRDVYALNLNCLDTDSRLPTLFSNVSTNSVILIEDIDKVFAGRENIDKESKVSFSSLLNCLDGIYYRRGAIVIITTNHIEKLDEALLRTGRMDVKLEIPLPSEKEISQYLSAFYQNEVVVHGEFNLKMSDVQEICISNVNSSLNALREIYSHEKVSSYA